MTQKTSFQTARYDTMFSTYYWNIWLDPKNPINKVECIPGYSKKQGFDESPHKIEMLQSIFVRLANSGYFQKITHIDFFERQGDLVNKKTDPKIFTLTQKQLILEDGAGANYMNIIDFTIFVKKFYDQIRLGKPTGHLIPERKKAISKDDFFDVTKHKFTTIQELDLYCSKLIVHKHPFGQVTNFRTKYLLQNTLV